MSTQHHDPVPPVISGCFPCVLSLQGQKVPEHACQLSILAFTQTCPLPGTVCCVLSLQLFPLSSGLCSDGTSSGKLPLTGAATTEQGSSIAPVLPSLWAQDSKSLPNGLGALTGWPCPSAVVPQHLAQSTPPKVLDGCSLPSECICSENPGSVSLLAMG